jgi:hypothetical protein
LNNHCRVDNYDNCFKVKITENVNPICNPQMAMFSDHVKQLTSSVNNAARSYQQYFPQFVRELARKQGVATACNRQLAVEMFEENCAQLVEVQVPLSGDPGVVPLSGDPGTGDPGIDNCEAGQSTFFAPAAQHAACERAMAAIDADGVLRDVCGPSSP